MQAAILRSGSGRLGAPATELWMDNYVIPTGAPNVEAAHAWINWLLTPEIGDPRTSNYHGYNSGLKNMERPAGRARSPTSSTAT